VSHDLCLYSHFEEFPLVGNPEAEAPGLGRATVFSGNAGSVVAWYELYCRGLGWDEAAWAVHLNGYDCTPPPAWADPDPVTRHIAMINAFLALAPGAKFGAS
jgi:hypothetical protein